MNRIDKLRLGFSMSVCAFIITVIASGHPNFMEMNPILSILFSELNTYYIIFMYSLLWGIIFTVYKFIDDNMSKYYSEYVSNFILLIGFFDLLHDVIMVTMYLI